MFCLLLDMLLSSTLLLQVVDVEENISPTLMPPACCPTA